MLKKVLSILLSMVMLFSATATFAGTTDVTDSVTGMRTRGDDFDQYDITTDTSYAKSHFDASANSPVFWLSVAGTSATIVSSGGKNNSKAFKVVRTNSDWVSVGSYGHATDANTVLELSFDIKAGYNTGGKAMSLGTRSSYDSYAVFKLGYDSQNQLGTINDTNGKFIANYSKDSWYRVVIRLTANGYAEGAIIDETGSVIANGKAGPYKGTTYNQIWAVVMEAGNDGVEVILDNATRTSYNETKAFPKITTAPSISGSESVDVSTNSVAVSLDQPIASASTATLTAATGESKTCTVTRDTSKLYTYVISWDAPLLSNTTYTLDLSGFKNSYGTTVGTAGNSAGIYTFKTAEAEVIADVESSNPADGATGVSLDTKSMTVTFNKEMTTSPETVTLTGGVTADVTTNDSKTFTFTWEEELIGLTTYTVSLADFKDAKGSVPATTSLSFTTETAEIVTLTDSFEDASFISSAKTSYTNSLLTVPAVDRTGTDVDEVSQVDGFKAGTKALQLKTGATTDKQYFAAVRSVDKYTVSEKDMFVATWRFRLDDMAAYDTANKKYGPQIAVGSVCKSTSSLPDAYKSSTAIQYRDGKLVVWSSNEPTANAREISEDKWYNITYVIGKNTEAIYFADAATGELVYKRQSDYNSNSVRDKDTYSNYIVAMYGARSVEAWGETNIYNDSQTFTIDDFTLWKIKPERANHKLALVGDVSENDGAFTLNFNQPVIADENMLELYLGEHEGSAGALKNERCYAIPTIKYLDFCKQEISFADLQNYTSYTIDYSGVKAASGVDLGDAKVTSYHDFTTEPSSDDISVVGTVNCNGMTAGSEITAKLYSQEARNVAIIAAFYNRTFPATLSTVQIEENVSLTEGINNINIELDKNIDSEYIRLYAWDGLSTMVPLMEEYETLAPVDSLDVLMIGNSLSEDAQRYLNTMAEAGGLDLNLTVKGVGGSTLTHHMNNLKAELEAGLDKKYNTDSDAVNAYITAAGDNSGRILYFTYENGVEKRDAKDNLLISALKEKQYDIISLQQFADYTDAGFEETLPYLTAKIRELQPNAEIVLYQTWSNYSSTQATRLDYFTDTVNPMLSKWAEQIGASVDNITVDHEAIKIIPAGHAFYIGDRFEEWCGKSFALTAGNTEASAQTDAEDWLNTSLGLWRDANHASYYGCYLADAVWYESLTGKKAPIKDASGNAIVPKPTGVGPEVEINGNDVTIKETTKRYFEEPTDEEHLAKLQQLSDIAHRIVLLNNK